MDRQKNIRSALEWFLESGVNEVIQDTPINRFEKYFPGAELPGDKGTGFVRKDAPLKRAGESTTKRDSGQLAASSPGAPVYTADPRRTPVASYRDVKAGEPQPLWIPGPGHFTGLSTLVEQAEKAAEKAENLEQLFDAIRGFDGCELKKNAMNTVLYRGNPKADIMLVGEAPGAEEDRQGRPFVGAAGQLLDKMLDAIDLGEGDVYITNVIFWRPPGNRQPKQEEIDVCWPFMRKQVELIKPRLIMTLGGVATKTMTGHNQGIMKLHGKWQGFTVEDKAIGPIALLPTFHPAYLLRQPKHKRLAWRDLLRFKAAVNGEESPQDKIG